MSTPVNFNARALTDPVDPGAVKAFHRANAGGSLFDGKAVLAIGLLVAVTVFVLGSLVVPMVMSGTVTSVPLPFLMLAFIAIPAALIAWRMHARRRVEQYRLSRFAADNALTYVPSIDAPPLPGMIFTIGSQRRATGVLRGEHPRFVEFADYTFTTGSGKSKQTHRWHYIALRIENTLPNIVLDARSNNAFLTNLPATFHRDQALSLEGDFNEHFTLYCPAGYERDALYLFTPDVMANFMDSLGSFDVEIVDNWIFLYTSKLPDVTAPAAWAWQFRAVSALLSKIAQWERWRDDRLQQPQTASSTATTPFGFAGSAGAVAPGAMDSITIAAPQGINRLFGVAPEGRRLRRSVNWGVISIAIAVGVVLLVKDFLPAIIAVFTR